MEPNSAFAIPGFFAFSKSTVHFVAFGNPLLLFIFCLNIPSKHNSDVGKSQQDGVDPFMQSK
jgi:hypothetical protein